MMALAMAMAVAMETERVPVEREAAAAVVAVSWGAAEVGGPEVEETAATAAAAEGGT